MFVELKQQVRRLLCNRQLHYSFHGPPRCQNSQNMHLVAKPVRTMCVRFHFTFFAKLKTVEDIKCCRVGHFV